MKKNNNKTIVAIFLVVLLLICILMFLSFCSKQPDSSSNSIQGQNDTAPTNPTTVMTSDFDGVNKPLLIEGM